MVGRLEGGGEEGGLEEAWGGPTGEDKGEGEARHA